jgi:hypothetical protein
MDLLMVETEKPGIRKIFASEGILLLPTWRCFRITWRYTERRHDILNHFDCIMTHCRLHFKAGFSPGIHVETIGPSTGMHQIKRTAVHSIKSGPPAD